MKPSSHRKAIIDGVHRLGNYRRDTFVVWKDWVELAAISLRNAVDKNGWQDRENRYLQIIKAYDKDEVTILCNLLADLVMAMEFETGDVLGSIFMELELGNKWSGQFFTPYDVCLMMEKMTLDPAKLQGCINQRGFVTASDPACGGGATMIAMAEEMRNMKFNPQTQLHVTGVDIDLKSVHMSYLQLSLLHIPALIVHGNALTVEQWDVWPTPAHIVGGWSWRLKRQPIEIKSHIEPRQDVLAPVEAPVADIVVPFKPTFGGEQVALF